jgi:carbonic anhydrase
VSSAGDAQQDMRFFRQGSSSRGKSRGDPSALIENVMEADWQGFSMAEARKHAEATSAKIKEQTPAEVLSSLQRGNTRFWMGVAQRPELSAFERRALLAKQFPTVAVLGCADSRVPVEIVFDRGLGDMFVVRVAGNLLDTSTLASLQYAVHHLKVKVVMVLGHEGCGAVKAAGLPPGDLENEPESLRRLLRNVGQGLDQDRLGKVFDKRAADREAVVSNVSRQVQGITKDIGIMAKVASQELIVLGAFYEISSGIVDWFEEVSNVQHGDEGQPVVHRGVSQRSVGSRKDSEQPQ